MGSESSDVSKPDSSDLSDSYPANSHLETIETNKSENIGNLSKYINW